jgi:TatD DNase family protein
VIDSHCHLAGPEFTGDLSAVVERATAAGVERVLCILSEGDSAEDQAASRLRELWPDTRFATGVHPHNAGRHQGSAAERVAAVERRVLEHGAAAIGEIGLDYHYDFAPRDVQQDVFRAQVLLARRLSLPIVIHTREATADTIRILREEGRGAVRGVFHCFTGDAAMAREVLDLGFFLSFSGIVTFPRAEAIREAASFAPADRILVETDAPYLAPIPYRGKRNEPAFVAQVVERLAEVRGARPEALVEQTTQNFHGLFAAQVS